MSFSLNETLITLSDNLESLMTLSSADCHCSESPQIQKKSKHSANIRKADANRRDSRQRRLTLCGVAERKLERESIVQL